ncbi:GmrSD restriction endonuclease domain-containing protein [Mycolicibacterium vaccae]|uniref:GmrSD restriction endonuclease domain-containing protein n=1 Tax=Mycolicibacterium vaccae TaxID=1810 RepID=UPI003CF452DC
MTRLSTLLDEIDSGVVLLPEFQRGYVWNRDQVRGLMRSLYRGYPVGGLLMWETTSEDITVRGAAAAGGTRQLLLDGQQRVTSMYGVVRGTPPPFFEGDKTAFTGLHFNVDTESFEFYAPTKMAGDPTWVNVTELFRKGPFEYLTAFPDVEREVLNTYLERLNRIKEIENRDFYYDKITGANKTVEEVVDIFNKVNSGGTRLSKGDLALARLCAEWPEARKELRDSLDRWKKVGFRFSLDWLLRNATAVATGRALFSSLSDVSAADFESALGKSVNHIGTFLDAASGRLGLDHDRVLMGRYATPVITRLLQLNGGGFTDSAHRDKVLYWYVHSALWGRFSGSTETYLQQDYEAVERGGIDALISTLERVRGGRLAVGPDDFSGSTRGSRFYPLLYLLTRVDGARDFGSGLELRAELLGKLTSLQVHHIFPKALLRKHGFDRNEINAIANFCFLTQDTNIKIGMRDPAEYLPEVQAKHPGVLESQWIPTDPELWRVERYADFLAARRELLAASAQSFLESLRNPQAPHDDSVLERLQVADEVVDDPRGEQVRALVAELEARGFSTPVVDTEIADPVTGIELAVAEAFWPDGLQPGIGQPVVLELDPDDADLPRLEELGYQVFTSVDALLGFIEKEGALAAGEPSAEEEHKDEPQHDTVQADFAQRMKDVYERGRTEAGYTASYFLSMLSQHGPQETAHRLLASPAISDGFAELWERGRLDLTVEALVVRPEFSELFSEEEIAVAKRRLEQFGYALGQA